MSRAKGDKAEAKVVEFLQANGFVIVAQNYYAKFGEIDIVAKRDGVLHFVEVKSAPDFETAIANITQAKLQKIIKAAQSYLKQHSYHDTFCIDAAIVSGEEIDFLENITL